MSVKLRRATLGRPIKGLLVLHNGAGTGRPKAQKPGPPNDSKPGRCWAKQGSDWTLHDIVASTSDSNCSEWTKEGNPAEIDPKGCSAKLQSCAAIFKTAVELV